jgi:hypothetical protein
MAAENIGINIHYSELRKFLIDIYKEAINSYADLAESIVDQKIQLLIEKKHLSNASSVKFSVLDDNGEKAQKHQAAGVSSSWASVNSSISSFGSYALPSYNGYLQSLTGTVEISGNSSSNFPYVVSGDTIMFSGGSNPAN